MRLRILSTFAVVLSAVLPGGLGAQAQSLEPSRIDVSTLGPQVGEVVPDFNLGDQSGNRWSRDGIMGPNGAMLVFFRSAGW